LKVLSMYEEAVGLGLGYLVYKRLMSELAKEPDNGGVTVTEDKNGGLLGFGDITSKELEVAIFGEGCIGAWCPQAEGWTGGFGLTGTPTTPFSETYEQWSVLYGSLLPEGFELVGPSRVGITRPKGLD